MKWPSLPHPNPVGCRRESMPPEETVTRFGLIRHAETVWNRERRVQGQMDSPLTSEGEQQAAFRRLQVVEGKRCVRGPAAERGEPPGRSRRQHLAERHADREFQCTRLTGVEFDRDL